VRERLTTLACALGALVIFASLFLHGAALAPERAALPTTAERGDSGLLGAMTWLAGEGIRTVSLRERFDTLARRRDLPPRGNLLIVSAPVATALKLGEVNALDRWVRAGNTLLVLAALSDKPAWAAGGFVNADASLFTGLDFVMRAAPPLPAARHPIVPLPRTVRATLTPNGPHPYVAGVAEAVALSDYTPQVWDTTLPRSGFVLSLAHERERGQAVLWVRPAGAGTVIVSGFASLFSNRALGLADNARLLANIVSASVAPAAAVLFDDEHQGLGIAYDPGRFYRDPRLYATLGVLLAVWLAWVLGSTRLHLPRGELSAPREAELVRATGTFLARVLPPAAAARRMFAHFFRRLPVRAPPAGEPPWEWLEHQPRLARADLRQLREWYADAYSDRRVPLARLHNLMIRTERQLAA